jgi:hypothetical protein
MMDSSKGLFASVHEPMKHNYIFLELYRHENIDNR